MEYNFTVKVWSLDSRNILPGDGNNAAGIPKSAFSFISCFRSDEYTFMKRHAPSVYPILHLRKCLNGGLPT
jgi:hypothetical protein